MRRSSGKMGAQPSIQPMYLVHLTLLQKISIIHAQCPASCEALQNSTVNVILCNCVFSYGNNTKNGCSQILDYC